VICFLPEGMSLPSGTSLRLHRSEMLLLHSLLLNSFFFHHARNSYQAFFPVGHVRCAMLVVESDLR
jgi:hypothetical protein